MAKVFLTQQRTSHHGLAEILNYPLSVNLASQLAAVAHLVHILRHSCSLGGTLVDLRRVPNSITNFRARRDGAPSLPATV
jgi:hypothetical protein